LKQHPDRHAATLTQCADAAVRAGPGPFAPPGPGARDARIDLKLLAFRAQQACARSERARSRLAGLAAAEHPDLWAGTVQDGTARGFAVALEEAVSLAGASSPADAPPAADDPVRVVVFTGNELRKKKDVLVAAAGARIRFARKTGVLFVSREPECNSVNCVRFEDRSDTGTLDAFAARADERPRVFSPQFLRATLLRQGPDFDQLDLEGRLGRGPMGFPCVLRFIGRKDEESVRLVVRVKNEHRDHRLRIRFLGIPDAFVHHECTDVREKVESSAGGFLAFTLVRACGRLVVDGEEVAVPGAQCLGWIEHEFRLGPAS
jgi:hypothetical protein